MVVADHNLLPQYQNWDCHQYQNRDYRSNCSTNSLHNQSQHTQGEHLQVMGWNCHAFTGCMGQPSTFNDFNKSYSRYKRENFCDSSERILYIHDIIIMIVMPRPLSVSQETIIVLRRSIRSVRCPETRESEFFLYNSIGKSIRTRSCVRYNV